ncbi:MAG: tetratricopeptide repeat protein [Acidobacteriota bacterium]|nr:tetratricopeptide repeat protein [Acidobacteriota bacterium]
MKQSIILLLVLSAWGQNRLQPPLQVGQRVQASLESGQTSAYVLELKKNQYIEVVAEQTSVDVVLRLLAPNGKQIEDVNYLGVGGTEQLIYLAEEDGNYRLEVQSAQNGRSGLYALRLTAARVATSHDLEVSKADVQLRTLAESKSPDAAETLERLAGEFAGFKMPQRQAVALTLAAALQIEKKDYQHGDDDSKKALTLWRDLKDRAGEGRVLSLLGSSAYRQNQYPQAIDYDEKALAIARALGDDRIEVVALQVLVSVQTVTGQAAKAATNAERVLAIKRAVKDRAGEASALVALGYAHFGLTHHEIALGYYEQALPIARAVGDRSIESSVLLSRTQRRAGRGHDYRKPRSTLYDGWSIREGHRLP